MIWLNPSALFAIAAAAAPILIHLLIHRKAERFPFPTLRFLQPTRLAAIRRHLLEDLPLLAVRIALLAAAVAALAGPLIVTSARRTAWNERVVRATVVHDVAGGLQPRDRRPERVAPHQDRTFEAAALADGIRRAVLWLGTAPPARREIVVSSPFPIGSITEADVAGIPADVGIRFERASALPATRTVAAGRLLTADGVTAREVILAGDRTSLTETATGERVAWPIDVISSSADRPAIDAAIAAVLSQCVWAPAPGHRARLVVPDLTADPKVRTTTDVVQAFRHAGAITLPWMADAAARIARDPDLRAAAARVGAGFIDASFSVAPWQILAAAADGRPLVAAAGSPEGLVLASAAPAADVATPVLLRAIANAIADVPTLQSAEVVAIPDAALQRWSRPSIPVPSPRIETVDGDDRRWLWLAALALLALEMWIRRARRGETVTARQQENARVA